MARSNAGRAVFKQDMAAKVWGGIVHYSIGTSSDKQIAEKLFKQVPLYLTRNYAMYPAYNVNWIPYVREYRDLPKKSASELAATYLKSTSYTKDLRDLAQRAGKDHNATIVLKTGLVGERFGSKPKFRLDPAVPAVAAAVSRAGKWRAPVANSEPADNVTMKITTEPQSGQINPEEMDSLW